jgi:hypothetical protein
LRFAEFGLARAADGVLVAIVSRSEKLNCLTYGYAGAGLIAKPGDRGNVAIGVKPLVSIAPGGGWQAVATLPGTERVGRNAGAQYDRARVVNWLSRQPAE